MIASVVLLMSNHTFMFWFVNIIWKMGGKSLQWGERGLVGLHQVNIPKRNLPEETREPHILLG